MTLILDISILVFASMEFSSSIILYFFPKFKFGNGVSVFKGYEESKSDENTHLLVKYLKNWVAGVKLIFVALLAVIVFVGSDTLKIAGMAAMIVSISTYYVALHPIIKKLDKNDKINPKGYSRDLFWIITGFMLMFGVALALYFFL